MLFDANSQFVHKVKLHWWNEYAKELFSPKFSESSSEVCDKQTLDKLLSGLWLISNNVYYIEKDCKIAHPS